MRIYLSFIAIGLLFSTWTYYLVHESRAVLAQESATVLFGGDMMLDRYIRTVMERRGQDYVFECLDPVLKDKDLVVANLEGPITDNFSVSQTSRVGDDYNMVFTFPPLTAKLLYDHNIRLVNLGNNHIMNFRRGGLLETLQYLDQAGVGYFGNPDVVDSERVARLEIRNVPLSFVNWSDWTSDNTDITAATVRAEADAGRLVVVYTHWGEEYVGVTDRQRRLAHSLVDQGADLVVGSHPHIVQEKEVYKGRHIYYSLGNMIFDQYWNEAVSTGLMLEVLFTRDSVALIKEIPIEMRRDGQTCPRVPPLSAAVGAILDTLLPR